jgi:DNA-binding CsgD family transcriptional regulator
MLLLDLRGRLRMAEGAVRAGLEDVRQCGRRADEYAMCNPALLPWRNHAVFAHVALGERDDALRLANEELDFAQRLAGPIAEGAALRALAHAGPRDERVDRLHSALRLLDEPPARLERARVLTDLGAVERGTGLLREAKEHLGEALDLATSCRAVPLAERARSELLAAGARPRRTQLHGHEALTASEARVARLAAQGLSNTAIAQTLFISRKTVEKHLANAYRKLGIASRSQLDAAAFSEPAAD